MFFSYSEESRLYMIIFLVFACIVLSAVLQAYGIDKVYTHAFYIPIVFSGIWWQRKGIITAMALGVGLLILHYIFRQEVSVLNDMLRAAMFLFVAVIVGEVSLLEKNKSHALNTEKEKLKASLEELKENRNRLLSSNVELETKNFELEKFSVLFEKRKERLEELEKMIAKMKQESK